MISDRVEDDNSSTLFSYSGKTAHTFAVHAAFIAVCQAYLSSRK